MKKVCNCVFCENNIPFSMPDEIIEATINNKLVIFAGSGVSTESKSVYPYTFYKDIASELGYDPKKISISFSELMSELCKRPNGRKELLKKIRYRIDYIKSFQCLYNMATRFHKELSSIFQIKEIFTTNWDDFFEIECGAIPFVNSDDLAFWDIPKRKVYKIHGSINNIGSIVATKEDYKKCYKNLKSNIIGSHFRISLATKVVVFIGYSFEDEDFNRIYSLLKEELGEIMPHSYIITINDTIKNKIDSNLVTPIITDGTYFIHKLKEALIKKGLLKDDSIDFIGSFMLDFILDVHDKTTSKFNICEYPNVLYTYVYQDGIIDALQRFQKLKCTGDYHNQCEYCNIISAYDKLRKEKIKLKKYVDVAYIDGYIKGLEILSVGDIKKMKYFPPYYIYGLKEEIIKFNDYKKIIKSKKIFHKGSFKLSKKIISEMNISEDMVYQHTPFLL